jgi:ATP-binding cassette subfamily F protein 2
MESIDGLANAINEFEGGMVLVSHDFRLIDQVARTIWVVGDKSVKVWKGDIRSYKRSLMEKLKKEEAADASASAASAKSSGKKDSTGYKEVRI